jgi:hypothetical protein
MNDTECIIHDSTMLVEALYGVSCHVDAEKRLLWVRCNLSRLYTIQSLHSRFVCLKAKGLVVILFHGSETVMVYNDTCRAIRPSERTLMDWEINVNIPLDRARDITPQGRIHRGFHQCFREEIMRHIAPLLPHTDPVMDLWLVGHSLGGALALLCGMYVSHRYPALGERTSVYTMGSPRVGDSDASSALSRGVRLLLHTQTPRDPIINTPPRILGYADNPGQHVLLLVREEEVREHKTKDGLFGIFQRALCGAWNHQIGVYSATSSTTRGRIRLVDGKWAFITPTIPPMTPSCDDSGSVAQD